jgi:hypothetical protein
MGSDYNVSNRLCRFAVGYEYESDAHNIHPVRACCALPQEPRITVQQWSLTLRQSLLLGTQTRSFSRVMLLEEKGEISASVSVGDLNGDGLTDI